jgi:hypothetical protein
MGIMTTSVQATHHHAIPKRHIAHVRGKSHVKPASARKRPTAARVAPHGVTLIPAGGVKLQCPPRRNPLLVRKMTQGNGTTVTVVCR